MSKWKAAVAACMALAGLQAAAQSAEAARIPVESFFKNPDIARPSLSPNGRFVALGVRSAATGRIQLAVMDTESMAAKVIASFTDGDVGRVDWVNDERLAFSIFNETVAPGGRPRYSGVLAVDKDGSNYRPVGGVFNVGSHDRRADYFFTTRNEWNLGDWSGTRLRRIDTRTGRDSGTIFPPGKTLVWVIDEKDEARVALTLDTHTEAALHLKNPKTDQWEKLEAFNPYERDVIYPLRLVGDKQLFVTARNGKDTLALHIYDLEKRALEPEPVVAVNGFDFNGGPIVRGGRVVGIRYTSDADSTVWLDADLKDLQKRIDGMLPGMVNLLSIPMRDGSPVALVRSYSDTDPGRFLLFNRATGKLTLLGQARKDIDPKLMGQLDLVRYKARDGLEIPAWLTLPKAGKGKKLPLVVLAHGGPWKRGGSWHWDSAAQFLASRGYAVLEPEFRGSEGYGFEHYRKGFRQWGLAMQDDLADGVRWAVQQGIADPGRICVAGAGYGGYAALMALAKDGDLFRCAFSYAAVTDLSLLFEPGWSSYSASYKAESMPVLLGEPDKDEALRSRTPLAMADRIRKPLLLAYGRNDTRVPTIHGVRLRDAVSKVNKDVEWVEYPEEGHGLTQPKHRFDYWERVEKFLATHLGK
ncbi:MAG: S9 family peptidase [Burkholderiales bacterium]|nr:S9 family peptidase [Burkholderiales bacterium]